MNALTHPTGAEQGVHGPVATPRGFICDHQLQRGNPPGAPQLVPAVARVIAVTGGHRLRWSPTGALAPPPTIKRWRPWA
jgi:hypothetical protein